MAYPAGPGPYIPSPAPRPPRRHGASTVLYIGLAVLVLGGITFVGGLYGISSGMEKGIGSGTTTIGSEIGVPETLGTSADLTVNLTADNYAIYVRYDTLLETGAESRPVDVDLTLAGPDGEPVPMESLSPSAQVHHRVRQAMVNLCPWSH